MGPELHSVVGVVRVAAWDVEELLWLAAIAGGLVHILSPNIWACQASH